MKNLLLTGAALLLAVAPASATNLVMDDFVYGPSAGDLTAVSAGAWTAHSGTTAVGYQPTGLTLAGYAFGGTGGSATIAGANSQDVNTTFAAQTGDVYASVLVNISSSGAGGYFLHFKDGSTGFRGRVWAADVGGQLRFGLTSSSSTAPTFPAVDFSFNTTYLIVVSYNGTTGASALHVLTSVPATEPVTPHQTDTGTATTMVAFAIRQGGTAGPTGTIDGIRVGTTWMDSVPVELMRFGIE